MPPYEARHLMLPQRRVDRVSQAVLRVMLPSSGQNLAGVRNILLDWLETKAGTQLPQAMRRGETDSHDVLGTQRVETVALADPIVWAARQDDQDRNVAGRSWVTEAMLASIDNRSALVGFRLHCVMANPAEDVARSIPKFMRKVAESYTVFLDDVETDIRAEPIQTPEDVDRLVHLIRSPGRRSPIVGLATGVPPSEEAPLIDADKLAASVVGTAHVRVISRDASFRLSDILGKRLSVFSGAVRIWWPGVDREGDPYAHPLLLAGRISDDGDHETRRAITERVLRASATRRDADHYVPSFAEARRIAATLSREQASEAGASAEALRALYEAENKLLLEQLKYVEENSQELSAIADSNFKTTLEERDDARHELYVARQRLIEMENALRARDHKPSIEYPDDFESLNDWAKINLKSGVTLLPRALRAARKSEFDNPPLAYQALLLLQEAYVPMRRTGRSELKQRWEDGLRQLKLECSPTHRGTRAGENPDDYFVEYKGRKVEVNQHLKGSDSREPRYCFRLYFFWSPDEESVVVASLPSHLETRLT